LRAFTTQQIANNDGGKAPHRTRANAEVVMDEWAAAKPAEKSTS
jgi:hypothetical protein